jgi:hypothetical protein
VFRADEQTRLARQNGIANAAPSGSICFERAAQRLSAEALLGVLEPALGNEFAAIQILDFSRQSLPQGNLKFDRTALSPTGLWRGSLQYGENRSVPVWVRVRITDTRTGSLFTQAAAAAREVERGDPVRVQVRSGGVLLAFDALAESPGAAGEAVLVRRAADGRRFRARIEGPGKVVIQK